MKDILKAVIPVAIGLFIYHYLANEGVFKGPDWLILLVHIATLSIVVYAVIRLFRRKKLPKS
ncbi:hypothetical protein ACO2Q8_16930 [Larkinella sp. VNQ87]|uniref:hypothetical protein n=1 Tax=Larkinella sp. VNQ87 TaxID=3400921 RepID=UPI003C0AFA38